MSEKTITTKPIKVACVQHECNEDKDTNLQRSIQGIRKAAAENAQLVLLQELHSNLYFCITQDTENFELAETIPGPTTEKLSKLAAELNIVLVISVFEKRATGLYHNTAIVLDSDGSIAGQYRKMHIPDDPGYHEKFYFTPGDLGFKPIKTSLCTLGVLICWDQWFPEAARLMALAGADILLYPTAIGWDQQDSEAEQQRQLDAWITVQRAHAIANGLHIISCNRVGKEKDPKQTTSGNQFWGHSFICGPQGEIIGQLNDVADTLIAEIDLNRNEEVRRIWPYFRDRRTDAYDKLLNKYID